MDLKKQTQLPDAGPEVIVTNMKKRFSGVSGTINNLLPIQSKQLNIGFVGETMPGVETAERLSPASFVRLSLWGAIRLSFGQLADGRKRIWHVRRDPEMMLGIFLRDILKAPILLVFTSAARYRHSWLPRWLIGRMNAVICTTEDAAAYVPNTTKIVPHGTCTSFFSRRKTN
jgi:mannosyltransferase